MLFEPLISLIVRLRATLQMVQLQFMIEKQRRDVLTLLTTFYGLSALRTLFSNSEMCQFGTAWTDELEFKSNLQLGWQRIVQRRKHSKLSYNDSEYLDYLFNAL